MLSRRVVVCLDVLGGRVVKGVEFQALRDVGDPVELARAYERAGADEVVFLDISASREARGTLLDVVRLTAERLFVPLTVGGGIGSVDDIASALRAGADKVSMNSAAVARPALLTDAAARFGAQCVVASIDAKREGERWRVYTHGGSQPTELDAVEWAAACAQLGAGEILLTSIDRDGSKAGYDVELTRHVADRVSVPVVASGGAGGVDDVVAVLRDGAADAALVAGIVHEGRCTVAGIKSGMKAAGLPVRAALMPESMQGLLEAVAEVARLAGSTALPYFRTALVAESKADGTPVTIADRSAEQAARRWIAQRFPRDGILGEEFGSERSDAPRQWIVDPIDGTKSFIRGVPLWGSLVAVADRDHVVAGRRVLPRARRNRRRSGGRGRLVERRHVAAFRESGLSRRRTITTTDERFLDHPPRSAQWQALASRVAVARSWGDCFGYLMVATGRAEAMVDAVLATWDAAPFLPIVAEAGGRVHRLARRGHRPRRKRHRHEPRACFGSSGPARLPVRRHTTFSGSRTRCWISTVLTSPRVAVW